MASNTTTQQQQLLPVIFQTIRRAQELDSLENEIEAHRYYLAAVQQISSLLQQQTISSNTSPAQCSLPTDRILQLYKMAKQCLEQAEALFNKTITEKRQFKGQSIQQQPQGRPPLVSSLSYQQPSSSSSVTSTTTVSYSASPLQPLRYTSSPHTASNNTGAVLRKSHSQSSPTLPSASVIRGGDRPHPQPHPQNNIHSLHKISPMEIARRKNMYLMTQYQTALKNNPTMSLPRSQNLSLGYLRRLEENLSIARYTEQNMARKLRQRELRLQETSQRPRSRSVESLTELQLKEEITHFEQGKSNITTLKQVLYTNSADNDSCTSSTAVVNLIHEVLNTTDHPLRRLFGECQYGIMQYLQPLVREIEKTGDLPRLDITETTPPKTTPTTESSKATPPAESSNTNTCNEESESSLDHWDNRLATLRAQLLELDSSSDDVTNNSNKDDVTNNSNKDDVTNNSDKDDVTNNSDSEDEYKTMASTNLNQDEAKEVDDQNETLPVKEETEEDVKFPSLPVLTCTTIYGNREVLLSLSAKYEQLLPTVTKMIHTALDKLVSSFALSYQPMGQEDNVDICRTALESLFFPAILPLITTLYRCINYEKECTVVSNMSRYLNATPKDLSVRRKYWLENQATPPYSSAIEQLKLLPTIHSPSPKLDSLVTLSKCIVQSIEDYYTTSNTTSSTEDTNIGVDDLLPIMTYVIIKCGLPSLISECSLLQEFIHEGYMMGEEGFCLTTFDTAMKYIVVMTT